MVALYLSRDAAPTEPLISQFSLQGRDTQLTLLDIIKNDLPVAGLAVLSACYSSVGDGATPDKTISLAVGLLFAGFHSVVETMWTMKNEDGLVMAEAFYNYMLGNGPEGVDC